MSSSAGPRESFLNWRKTGSWMVMMVMMKLQLENTADSVCQTLKLLICTVPLALDVDLIYNFLSVSDIAIV